MSSVSLSAEEDRKRQQYLHSSFFFFPGSHMETLMKRIIYESNWLLGSFYNHRWLEHPGLLSYTCLQIRLRVTLNRRFITFLSMWPSHWQYIEFYMYIYMIRFPDMHVPRTSAPYVRNKEHQYGVIKPHITPKLIIIP